MMKLKNLQTHKHTDISMASRRLLGIFSDEEMILFKSAARYIALIPGQRNTNKKQ